MSELHEHFGQIDIYLFDQILRKRIVPGMRILDAGCGFGRNLVYFLQEGYEVFGVDADPAGVDAVRRMARDLAPGLDAGNFRVEAVEALSFPDDFADVVVSSAVLHFARDDAHFESMVRAMWRVLKPGGLLFCRLASNIGLEQKMPVSAQRRRRMPDGSDRYVADEGLIMRLTEDLGGKLADPLKTTVVQNQRAMTTWVTWK